MGKIKKWMAKNLLHNPVVKMYSRLALVLIGIGLMFRFGWWGLLMFMALAIAYICWVFYERGTWDQIFFLGELLRDRRLAKKKIRKYKREKLKEVKQ